MLFSSFFFFLPLFCSSFFFFLFFAFILLLLMGLFWKTTNNDPFTHPAQPDDCGLEDGGSAPPTRSGRKITLVTFRASTHDWHQELHAAAAPRLTPALLPVIFSLSGCKWAAPQYWVASRISSSRVRRRVNVEPTHARPLKSEPLPRAAVLPCASWWRLPVT